jgi:hypothetical protein
VRVEPGAHPQGQLAGRLPVVGVLRGQCPGLLLDLLGRRVGGEQPEQLECGAGHVAILPSRPRRWSERGVGQV